MNFVNETAVSQLPCISGNRLPVTSLQREWVGADHSVPLGSGPIWYFQNATAKLPIAVSAQLLGSSRTRLVSELDPFIVQTHC